MKEPEININIVPTNDILMFGDGMVAQSLGATEGQDNDGREIVDFVLKPSDILRKRFKIPDDELDRNGMMKWRALKSEIIPLNNLDPARRMILYKLNFLHEDTALSSYAKDLAQDNDRLKRKIRIKEGEVMHLTEQLELAKTRPFEFLNQGIDIQKKWSEIMNKDKPQQEEN